MTRTGPLLSKVGQSVSAFPNNGIQDMATNRAFYNGTVKNSGSNSMTVAVSRWDQMEAESTPFTLQAGFALVFSNFPIKRLVLAVPGADTTVDELLVGIIPESEADEALVKSYVRLDISVPVNFSTGLIAQADLYAWDVGTAAWVKALVESAANPNLRASIFQAGNEAVVTTLNDGAGIPGSQLLNVLAFSTLFTGSNLYIQRTPNVFKTVAVSAAGNTTVWLPAAGKKFRLMGGFIQFSGDLAVAGLEVLLLQDAAGGTTIIRASAVLGTTLVAGETVTVPLTNMGNGFLSAVANNVLNANLGTALAAGEVTISVWGTEE